MLTTKTLVSIGACTKSHADSLLALGNLNRFLSVVSWGRNLEGQCGVETAVVVARPTTILEFHGQPVAQLKAGKLHSAAVSLGSRGEREAWTWGCGKAGKLGHGSGDSMFAPSRVEALVGRADVAQVACGDQHTLFLDAQGGVWSCGENKEGQCGLGTPLEVIAAQHRKSFFESMRPMPMAQPHKHSGPRGRMRDSDREQQLSKYLKTLMQGHPPSGHAQPQRRHGAAFGAMPMGGSAGGASWQLHVGGGGGGSGSQSWGNPTSDATRLALGWGGFNMEGHFNATGLQPGHLHTPTRIGRDQHPLSALYHKQQSSYPDAMRVVEASGLENEEVVGMDASRYFSIVVTSRGEVWTFGACYNGALGSDSSWSTAAQKVSGALAQTIADNGGAVQVQAGGTFCLALTATGKVVVWGKVPSADGLERETDTFAKALPRGVNVTNGHRVLAGEIPGLPPIKHMSAGQSHALLSDGERVWAIGRLMNSQGEEDVTSSWSSPKEVLHLPAEGVQSITCGAHSSAAVGGDGRLWMWGRLLEFHHLDSLLKRYPGSHTQDVLLPEDVRWKWSGFGADKPTVVEGVSGVKAVALGGWHGMALVE